MKVLSSRVRDIGIQSPALGGQTTVRLILPAGFGVDPARRWPVLNLLHGVGGSYASWSEQTNVVDLVRDLPIIVAMPNGGDHGFYSNWWNGGAGGPPAWETYHTEELAQILERGYGASGTRAIAGLSMGGLGAISYAARHPGMYAAVASFSGVLDTDGHPIVDPNLWGDPKAQASTWAAHNPLDQAAGLRGIPLFLSWGNGQPGPLDAPGTGRDSTEQEIARENAAFAARLQQLGISATVDAYGPGTHTWPYWDRELQRALPTLMQALTGSAY